jgi:hypothetical protein
VTIAGAPRSRAGLLTRLGRRFRTRAAFGLGPAAAPVAFFVPLGVLLGPQLFGWLSTDVLVHLDTGVSVALATLGVFVGLALGRLTAASRRVLVCASLEAGTTLVIVGLATWVLATIWRLPLGTTGIATALMLGICASVSSVGPEADSVDPNRQIVAAIADLDDVAPILIGALLVAGLHEPTAGAVLWLGLVSVLAGGAVAVAGWLLFEVAHGPAERGVYVIGVLVMLGGTAAYLALSPLLIGLIAGVFWVLAPGHADTIIESDLRKVQHPLVVLLLLTAGASLRVTPVAIWLLAPFVIFRVSGKLAGSWLASWYGRSLIPADLGTSLIWPGVVSIAFALNFQQVAPPDVGGAVLTTVALGGVASEVAALLVAPEQAGP